MQPYCLPVTRVCIFSQESAAASSSHLRPKIPGFREEQLQPKGASERANEGRSHANANTDSCGQELRSHLSVADQLRRRTSFPGMLLLSFVKPNLRMLVNLSGVHVSHGLA